jgi:hypothetical protein
MLIERPRTPQKVKYRGKLVYRVGHYQMVALHLLGMLGRMEVPPKGIITATGKVREHTFRDMFPQGFVDMYRPAPGVVQYDITARGKEVLRDGITLKGKPAAKVKTETELLVAKIKRGDDNKKRRKANGSKPASLLSKQRAKAKKAKAAPAAGKTQHEPRVAARRA